MKDTVQAATGSDLVLTHPWQEAGLGTAPFSFITIISWPGTALAEANPTAYQNAASEANQAAHGLGVHLCMCNYCGHDLMNNFVIRDANGAHFVVGCDCVRKTGDAKLITAAELAEKKRVKALEKARQAAAAAQRRAAYEVELDAQRARNGGMTDGEIESKRIKADLRQQEINRVQQNIADNRWLVDVLEQAKQTPFTESITGELRRGEKHYGDLSDKCWGILADIYARVRGPQLKAAGWTRPEHSPGIQTAKDAAYCEMGDKRNEARR